MCETKRSPDHEISGHLLFRLYYLFFFSMQLLEQILEEINSPDVNLMVSALSQWFYFFCLFVKNTVTIVQTESLNGADYFT